MTTKITDSKKLGRTKRESLLRKSKVEYADYAINHVEGCSHGCKFPCYAMTMARRRGVTRDYSTWIKPKIVSNALNLLDKEIPKLKDKIKAVHLCFMTDPFMSEQPEIVKLTLNIIKRLNKDNLRSIILTKGIYPKALANTEKFGKNNEYGITLVSLDEKFRKQFEPGATPYKKRIRALKYLHDQGLKTWVSMEPYPTPNMVKQDLNKILDSIKFVNKIIFGKLNYNSTANQYLKGDDSYYLDCAETVNQFCQKNGIELYIKNKTL